MKKLLLLVTVFFVSFYGSAQANCNCAGDFEECGKVYVQPSQVIIKGNMISVQFEDGVVHTPALYADAAGLYFTAAKYDDDCESPKWQCTYCRQCNDCWYSRCPKCHVWR